MKEPNAKLIASPRLRGEVGSRAQRGFRVRGKFRPHRQVPGSREGAPQPGPLPATRARGYHKHAMRQRLRQILNLMQPVPSFRLCHAATAQQGANTTLRFVPHADLSILDPYFTGVYIT
jgi:hypothetical protein